MHMLNHMVIEADVHTLLATLRSNREEHAQIVAEARDGYIEKARTALEKRLAEAREGKMVSLSFRLDFPQDHTKTYDVAIRMLELHQGATITLSAMQVRNLEMDEWDWTDSFLNTASAYSPSANAKLDGR